MLRNFSPNRNLRSAEFVGMQVCGYAGEQRVCIVYIFLVIVLFIVICQNCIGIDSLHISKQAYNFSNIPVFIVVCCTLCVGMVGFNFLNVEYKC